MALLPSSKDPHSIPKTNLLLLKPIHRPTLIEEIKKKVLIPAVNGMRKEKSPYVGVLFAGILLDEKRGPQVLEFNARFGDPETQGTTFLHPKDMLTFIFHQR
jgi:phosphoribosylamine---glycine ligase